MIQRLKRTARKLVSALRTETVVIDAVTFAEKLERQRAALDAADTLAERVDAWVRGEAPDGALVRGVERYRAARGRS